nr:hypothetical protein CFP56_13168 [Quercus suber]
MPRATTVCVEVQCLVTADRWSGEMTPMPQMGDGYRAIRPHQPAHLGKCFMSVACSDPQTGSIRAAGRHARMEDPCLLFVGIDRQSASSDPLNTPRRD